MRIPYRKPGKFSLVKPDPLLTTGKFNELENKLTKLKKRRPQAMAEVARLAEMGDFSENVAYQIAKGRLRGINQGILELDYQLNHAVIIAPENQTDCIQVGHRVTIENNGVKKTYEILGSAETSPEAGVISHRSPLGMALLGHKVGEMAKIKLKNKEVKYKIIRIE
jgi:transcription elongation factor GreA